ncbi:MAG: hypothetical protein [Bacteriophage sp.]|nr:MAG: hypothetical protein [Bacteriophage sp.]
MKKILTFTKIRDIIVAVRKQKPYRLQEGENMDNMTDKQLQFIAWLITTATDKCETIEEVREMNNEIRKHSAGLLKENTKENE